MTDHLAWMQRLPSGWRAKPLRSVSNYVVSNVDKIPVDGERPVRLCNYSDVYNNEFISLRLDFMTCTATEDETRKFGLRVDDVIITKDSESWDDIGIPALVVETAEDLVCGYHLALLRPHETALSGRFLFRCLQAKVLRLQLELAANGVTRFGLPKSDIGAMRLPVPPLERQLAIADFLDRETARIDALVAAKQRLLDLLVEKRKAIIATAVTRGVDPKVKLRDSGVPWLGEIPAHWKHRNLRYCCTSIQTGGTPAPEFLDYEGEDGLDWFTPGDFGETLVPERSSRRVAPGALSAGDLKVFPTGAVLVVGIGATLGKVALLVQPASANQQVNALTPRDDVHSAYLAYEMTVLADLLRVSANTATLPILNQQRMGDVPVLVPPLDEQRAVVAHIARETAKLDAVRAAAERTIALLKERRSALIAAAVTGQLDVGAAA